MKRYLITKGLREDTNVKKAVRLDRPETYNQLLAIVNMYIRYEEEVYTINLNKIRKEESAVESSTTRRRKAKLPVKAKDPAVVSRNTPPVYVQGKDPRRDFGC